MTRTQDQESRIHRASQLNDHHALKNGRTGRVTASMFGFLRTQPRTFEESLNTAELREEELDPHYQVIMDVGAGMASTAAELSGTKVHYIPVDPMYCNFLSSSELLNETRTSIESIGRSLSHPAAARSVSESYLASYEANDPRSDPLNMYYLASQRFMASYENDPSMYRCGALPDEIPSAPGCQLAVVGNYLLFRNHDTGVIRSSIESLLNQCDEVRIHPVCDYYGRESAALEPTINHFSQAGYQVQLINVTYHEFKSPQTLIIRRDNANEFAAVTSTALNSFGAGFLHGLLPKEVSYGLCTTGSLYAPLVGFITVGACKLLKISDERTQLAAHATSLMTSVVERTLKGADLVTGVVSAVSTTAGWYAADHLSSMAHVFCNTVGRIAGSLRHRFFGLPQQTSPVSMSDPFNQHPSQRVR